MAVRAKTKICDPKNPPRMVISLEDPSCVLNSCIPANVIRQRVEAMTHETDVGTAIVVVFVFVVDVSEQILMWCCVAETVA